MDDAYFVNVFREHTGKIHYSTEEFSVHQNTIRNRNDALEDAYRFAVLGDWRYVCTLSRNDAVTTEIRRRLAALENAQFMVESLGKIAENYRAEELEEEAENFRESLCADATLANYISKKP